MGNAQSGIRVFPAATACAGRSIWKPWMQAHDLLQELPAQLREATVPPSLPVSQTSRLHGCEGALWVGVREPGSDPAPALHEPHRHSLNFHFLGLRPGSKRPLPDGRCVAGVHRRQTVQSYPGLPKCPLCCRCSQGSEPQDSFLLASRRA